MTKLFISYAHADGEIVLNISKELQQAGYEVWIDTHGIRGGTLWGSEIVRGIKECDIFLLFVSSKSILSDYVRREVDIAFEEKRKIIPIRLEKVDIPTEWDYQLAGIQYIEHQEADWKSRLLDALGGQPVLQSVKDTGKLRNPYASLPVLEPIERILILANREKELKKGIEHLENNRLLLVTGMPGIGKSTFARALLEFMPAGSPTAFWYNFARFQSSGNTLGGLLDRISTYLDLCLNAEVRQEVMAFRNSPAGTASASDVDILIGFLNQDLPIWLVFDNLETVLSRDSHGFLDEGLDILFDSLKNNTHSAKIIVTNPFVPVLKSGEPLLETGTRAIALEGLDDAFAISFLRAYGLQSLPEDKLASLVKEINGHPFILNYMARYIQTMGVAAAMENLQGGLEETNERFRVSLEQRLSPQEFNALQSLTILQREISLDGLCQVALSRPGIMVRLREKGLLQTNDAGKFWLHNIVRNSMRYTDPESTRQAHLRAMNFYRSLKAPPAYQSIDDYAGVLEWHHHAVQADDLESSYAALYATGLEEQLMLWNEYSLIIELGEQTLLCARKTNIGLPNRDWINIQHTLGIAYFFMGDASKSIECLKSAVDSLQPEEDQELRIKLLIDLSESYDGNKEFELAMEVCQKAITLLTNVNNESLQAKVLHLRGIINRDQGILEQAINDLEEALKIYESLKDQLHIASITGDLGLVYYYQNRFVEAVANYRRAIFAYEINRDLRGAMIAHSNIGDIMLQDQQYELAEAELQIALELARQKKIESYELDAGLSLVEARIALLHLDKAQEELNALRPLLVKHTSPCISGRELSLIASLYWKGKNLDLAKDYFRRAFDRLGNEDCQYEYARACLPFASFLKEQGQPNEAAVILQKAEQIFVDLNNQLGLRTVTEVLSSL